MIKLTFTTVFCSYALHKTENPHICKNINYHTFWIAFNKSFYIIKIIHLNQKFKVYS